MAHRSQRRYSLKSRANATRALEIAPMVTLAFVADQARLQVIPPRVIMARGQGNRI